MAVLDQSIIKTVLRYTMPAASEVLNVFHHRYVGPTVDEDDINDAIEDWATNDWGATWADTASAVATLLEYESHVVDLDGLVLAVIGSGVLGIDGGVAAQVMPAAVSAYMSLNTLTPGVRGSKYVPGTAETLVDDGVINATLAADLALLLLDYLGQIPVAGGGNLVSGVPSEKTGTWRSFISGGVINLIPAYQRRRKLTVGS